MVWDTLLARVSVPPAKIHRIRGELAAAEAAKAFSADLTGTLGAGGRLDLVLLGMGSDGHTASLFPGTDSVEEQFEPVVPQYVESMSAWRVTLTLPTINAARSVVFIVSGRRKRETLRRVRSGEKLPAAMVQPNSGQLLWLVDREAHAPPWLRLNALPEV
jgi:6-phosphogluconolactonase